MNRKSTQIAAIHLIAQEASGKNITYTNVLDCHDSKIRLYYKDTTVGDPLCGDR